MRESIRYYPLSEDKHLIKISHLRPRKVFISAKPYLNFETAEDRPANDSDQSLIKENPSKTNHRQPNCSKTSFTTPNPRVTLRTPPTKAKTEDKDGVEEFIIDKSVSNLLKPSRNPRYEDYGANAYHYVIMATNGPRTYGSRSFNPSKSNYRLFNHKLLKLLEYLDKTIDR